MAIKEKENEQKAFTRVPETMRAAAIDRFGAPAVLSVRTLPVPPLGREEVLIAVDTAGVGSWDADIRSGWFPGGHPKFPLVLGTDGAGHVAAAGSHVRRFRVGDAVYSFSFLNPKGGFYAGYACVDGEKVAPAPRGLDLREAGAIPATGLTALQGVDDALAVGRDDLVVILGASGGVGTLAIQFAKLRGARVLATASGTDGLALIRSLGADAVVDARLGNLAETIRAFAPNGVDAVLALAGGGALEESIAAIKPGGRLAYPHGVEPEPRKHHGIRITAYDAVANVRQFDHLTHAVEAAKLRVPIAAEFALGDAGKAHERIANGHVLGKIILRI